MEKLVVEENEIIKEEHYQKVKKILEKKDDWFAGEEILEFTEIYKKPGEI